MNARLKIEGIKKAFGPTIALGGVSLSVAPSEVHALVGENGAGKSTLMKLLVGAERPDEGAIWLDGAEYAPRGPADATRAGIAMVHQERSLCAHLTAMENIALGIEPTRFGIVEGRAMRALAEAALRDITGDAHTIAADAIVGKLSPGDQQLVEIARAIARASANANANKSSATSRAGCRVLILDEPTSSLGQSDAERLFARVRALRERNMAILYISHFLEEIISVADRFTVLRDGKTVGGGAIAETSAPAIVRMMSGRAVDTLFVRSERTRGEPILALDGLGGVDKPVEASLTLHRGEVLGLAGLVGSGRTELLRAVFGLDPVVRGSVRVGAVRESSASPAARLAQGVGLVSEDRKGEGLAGQMSIADNLTMSKLPHAFTRGAGSLPAVQAAIARRYIEELGVRCRDPWQPIDDLSGGNQQKVALARLLHHGVDVLLLDEPTRGIDVASKAQIYALIDALAKQGKAVLFVSSYLPELLGVCDRIAVMHRGKLEEARPVREWEEASLLASVTGASTSFTAHASLRETADA